MLTRKSDSMVKKTLRSLCCSNGWSYGALWGFDQRNSLLLTLQDSYCKEELGALIDDMFLQVHVLGGGVIGQVASDGNHCWMFSDAHKERQNSFGLVKSLEFLQDDSEVCSQFLSGIQTIALISVGSSGVVQFGSTLKIPESKEFVDQVKEHLRGEIMCQESVPSENEPSCSSTENFGVTGDLNSLVANPSSDVPDQTFSSISDLQSMKPFVSRVEGQIVGSNYSDKFQHVFPEATTFFDCSAAQTTSTLSRDSVLASSWHHLPYELDSLEALDNLWNEQNSTLLLNSADLEAQGPSSVCSFEDLFKTDDLGFSKPSLMNGVSQWLSPPLEESSTSFAVVPVNSSSHAPNLIPSEQKSCVNISENLPTNSRQSSITDAFNSDAKRDCSYFSGINNILDSSGVEAQWKKPREWNQMAKPIAKSDHVDFTNDNSECISDRYGGSGARTSNSLFSKLGLDHLLAGRGSTCSYARSSLEDQFSSASKRRKIENSSLSHEQGDFGDKMKFLNPVYNLSKTIILEPESEGSAKGGSWIGDSYSMTAGKTNPLKKSEQPAKAMKKKAKPGTRPRPKDRQLIHDRLAELRELIPNGEKMSIDRLLERTIRHLNFMQGLKRHSESLKQADKPKNNCDNSSNGVTWACEVGDQTMLCPLKVEDLSIPGQMLIEILCEEQGFFLEIVDIIRGFGLTILKGVMESRETKIWAHFIVEPQGSRHVTRHEIFSSLIQLLQMAGPSEVKEKDQLSNIFSSGSSLFDNYQPVASLPATLVDSFNCSSF